MSFQNEYPQLFQFFGSYFPDADLDGQSDEEVVANYIADCKKSEISTKDLEYTGEELISLMNNIEVYWQDVSEEANRYFTNDADALQWLKMIQLELLK